MQIVNKIVKLGQILKLINASITLGIYFKYSFKVGYLCYQDFHTL